MIFISISVCSNLKIYQLDIRIIDTWIFHNNDISQNYNNIGISIGSFNIYQESYNNICS